MKSAHDRRFTLVLACFLLSGFAALLFQTVWTREFAFVFGTSDLAVATVLAAYMGGLAVGAAVAGRLAARLRRPVLVYGVLELGIGLTALGVPLAIGASRALAVAFFGGRATLAGGDALGLALFYLACSFAILLLPTALMGATLPLLTRDVVRRGSEIGSRVGALYATNTLGAVLGTLVAGFLLLPRLGLRETVWVGAGVNLVVFALAVAISRLGPAADSAASDDGAQPGADEAEGDLPRGRGALVLPLIMVSGIVSFTYEVLWTRLLGHVMGGSVYAFATMLASFLVGISAGSALATRFARTGVQAARSLAVAQLGIAATALAAFFALDALPQVLVALGGRGMETPGRTAFAAAAILVPSTLWIGATFPLAVRVLARGALGGAAASRASARVYAWNTAGAIVGAVGAGFFVVPALGYAGSLGAAVALNLGLAVLATRLAPERPRMAPLAVVASLGLLLMAVVRLPEPWSILSVSPFGGRQGGEVTYFGVGRSATVLLTEQRRTWSLRTNGLPEAGVQPLGQRSLQQSEEALTAIPVLARPDTRSMLVIGLGGGSAVETVPASVREIDVIELEPEVLAANRTLSGRRARDPLADPRVQVHLGDARGALVLTGQRWDAIVSQPSHPWTAGASHLYTLEFFEQVRAHLSPGGVFLQWIGGQFVDEALLRTLVATLREAFPHVVVFCPPPSAQFLFLASDAPLDPVVSAAPAIAASPETFQEVGFRSQEDVAVALWLDEDGARRFSEGAPISTDEHNLLQIRSPRVLQISRDLGRLAPLFVAYDDLPVRAQALDALVVVRQLLATQDPQRAERVAQRIADRDIRSLARALIALGLRRAAPNAAGGRSGAPEASDPGDPEDAPVAGPVASPVNDAAHAQALATLSALLERRPELDEARWALVRDERTKWLAGDPETVALAAPLGAAATAVLEAWRLEAAGNELGIRALEAELAAASPEDPAWGEAIRLRAVWRVASAEPALAREALAILDRAVVPATPAPRLLVRARAAALAGHPGAAVDAIAKLSTRLGGSTDSGELARAASALLANVPADPLDAERRRNIEQRLAPYLAR